MSVRVCPTGCVHVCLLRFREGRGRVGGQTVPTSTTGTTQLPPSPFLHGGKAQEFPLP